VNIRSQLGEDLYKAAAAHGATMTYRQIAGFVRSTIEDLSSRAITRSDGKLDQRRP
jgi:hypothetical protein